MNGIKLRLACSYPTLAFCISPQTRTPRHHASCSIRCPPSCLLVVVWLRHSPAERQNASRCRSSTFVRLVARAMDVWDTSTKSTVQKIPLLTVKAGPREGEAWKKRLKEEYQALIAYIQMNKSRDNDWFSLSPANPEGTKWKGKCWYIHNLLKYEFDLQFDIPVTYPATAPELELPELDGKTPKMYRGGKICLTIHFKPLWAKNSPHFGIAHALCLGMGPWLAAEVPHLVDTGVIRHKDNVVVKAAS